MYELNDQFHELPSDNSHIMNLDQTTTIHKRENINIGLKWLILFGQNWIEQFVLSHVVTIAKIYL
jgi:hypothetical protein